MLIALAFLLCASAVHAQGAAPYQWRALYQGQLGGGQATLDLTLGQDGFAYGRLTLAGVGLPFAGAGTHGDDGSFSLALREVSSAEPTSVAIDLAYQARRMDPGSSGGGHPAVLSLTGERSLEWTDDGRTVRVTLEHLAPTSAPEGTATWERVAQYAFGSVVEGRLVVSYAYPRSLSGERGPNELLERGAAQRLARWLEEGRALVDGGEGLGWGWTHSESTDLLGEAGPYLSYLTSFYYYTGGAHPNGHVESLLLERSAGGVRQLGLAELFEPAQEWLARIGGAVLTGLREQGADAVVSGEITQLSEQDLASFTLGPAGLTFHFDPYAVGPYVQGSFRVTVPYEELLPLAGAGGPIAAFAEKFAGP